MDSMIIDVSKNKDEAQAKANFYSLKPGFKVQSVTRHEAVRWENRASPGTSSKIVDNAYDTLDSEVWVVVVLQS